MRHTVEEFAEVFGSQWQFVGMTDGQQFAMFQHRNSDWVNAVNLETGEVIELN